MPKVLHYKTNFLNPSETFIDRLIRNHDRFQPIGMCINKDHFTDHFPVFSQPDSKFQRVINTVCFHLNWSLPFYRKVIEAEKPDIIHAHFGFDGYRMYWVAKQTNTPLVVSFYGSDVSRLPTEFDWKRRYKKLAKNAQAFIAASQLMKLQLIDLGFPEEKIKIIRFGVDIKKFSYQKNSTPNNQVMMVGRMVEKKGFKYALKAVQILKNKGRNIHLDLFGDGPLREELENFTKQLKIENRVTFHGYVANEKVRCELNNHSALLAPSVTASDDDKEGLPNTILESMASGTPVIASDHAAIPEAVIHKKTGLLVPERDSKTIASNLEQLIDRKFKVDEMQKKARKLIEEQYSVEQLVENTESIYTKLINSYEQ